MITFRIFFVVLIVSSVNAKSQYGSLIVSKVISSYDGDTFKVNIGGIKRILRSRHGILFEISYQMSKRLY